MKGNGEDMEIAKIKTAIGEIPPDLVLKNAQIVNVFTGELERGDIAICGGTIVGVGEYSCENETDLSGRTVCPGFIDGHIHIESSMLLPREFAAAALRHGTTAAVVDPHEIANVCGTDGIDFMLAASDGLPVDIYFMLPSCVPATALDESGAELCAADLLRYYGNPRVLGLAEMMNYPGVLSCDRAALEKLSDAYRLGKLIDGHAPGVSGKRLNAYITAGVQTDHECSTFAEAKERVARGQWVMIREGTAAKNLEALLGLFTPELSRRCLLVTDDKHPGELLRDGHIDYIIKKAASLGADAITAVRMATINAASCFGLKNTGAVAPGYRADLVVLDSLDSFNVLDVYKNGVRVVENGMVMPFSEVKIDGRLRETVMHSFRLNALSPDDFTLKATGTRQRVISLIDGELLTREKIVDYLPESNGVDLSRDIIKLAVIERSRGTGHIGLGYLHGYGLRCGAVASSVAHDSHNIIVAGTNGLDMAAAANRVRETQGGWAIALDGKIISSLELPVAGLMSEQSAEEMAESIRLMKETAAGLGVSGGIDAFMTLAFLSLPVIPDIKMTTFGPVDVASQKVVEAIF